MLLKPFSISNKSCAGTSVKSHIKAGKITKQLFQLLKRAYTAEIGSQSIDASHSRRYLTTIARNKSALPFQIIQELSLQPYIQSVAVYDRILSRHIGTIFWLLDDLVDLLKDFNSQDLNALLTSNANRKNLDDNDLFTE